MEKMMLCVGSFEDKKVYINHQQGINTMKHFYVTVWEL